MTIPELEVFEILAHSLRSAFVASPHLPSYFNAFDQTPGDPLRGDPNRMVSRGIHSNQLFRNCLPEDREVYVFAWRAQLNQAPTEEFLEWATDVSVEFIYNLKLYASTSLVELIHASQTISNNEPLGRPWTPEEAEHVLKEHPSSLTFKVWRNWLPVLLRPKREFRVEVNTPRLWEGKRVLVWLYLDGYMRRPVQ